MRTRSLECIWMESEVSGTTITIDRDQRAGLYDLVRNHLGSIEDDAGSRPDGTARRLHSGLFPSRRRTAFSFPG